MRRPVAEGRSRHTATSFKKANWRDTSESELLAEGVLAVDLDGLARHESARQVPVTLGKGTRENRRGGRSIRERWT